MIRTLAKNDQLSRQCDVLVIGAGTVGLIVATQLAQSGRNVICLESGQMRQEADEHPLNEVVHTRLSYEGAAHGRFRCLGGTSTRWGGALIPFARADVEGAQWPIPYDDIVRFVPEVEALFGLTAGRYEAEDVEVLGEGDFVPRLAKWPPFGKRNVANLVGKTASR